jgi:two-component system chemotaxis response regulator CheB
MAKIRVLVVDDSVVIRRLLTDVLNQDADIEVAGTAPNGRIALAKLSQLNPDIVTLDIEMPELDGLATLPELRKDYPKLPVIMFSSLTERGAAATFEALSRGATDYVAKPSNVGSVAAGMQSVRDQLIPKIKALCAARPSEAFRSPAAPNVLPRTRPRVATRLDALVIGASTGGPRAVASILSELSADFPLPIAIVQHMPPIFTKHWADRLQNDCNLRVSEAAGGEVLERGAVLVAPGDYHLELVRKGTSVVAALNQAPPENSCRPAVDVLFRSAANVYGSGCLGLVLTGMGSDGRRGAECIVAAGGAVLAQDEATSVVWGMPRAVVEAQLAAEVLPLGAIAKELQCRAGLGRRTLVTA